MDFSSKQIDIINGTIRLLDSGKDLNKITVQEIADFTGIGKGSVYDHFKSKDDIIKATIIKNFSDGFIKLNQAVKKNINFKDKVFSLYNLLIIDIKSQSSLSILNLICSAGSFENIKYIFKKAEISFASQLESIVKDILIQGIKENKFPAPSDKFLVEMIIFSNLSTLSRFITASHLGFEDSDETIIKENAYKLLIKSLN